MRTLFVEQSVSKAEKHDTPSGTEEKDSLRESGDVHYFCDKCELLIEESREDAVVRCP
jgi:hypothetical protein